MDNTGGYSVACRDRSHREHWRVSMRHYNASAFNGYRRTPSAYSEVRCTVDDKVWRTKAAYVDSLPDYWCESPGCDRPGELRDHVEVYNDTAHRTDVFSAVLCDEDYQHYVDGI